MKILIYGSNGWIGGQVIKYLEQNNIEYIKGLSRVDEYDELEKEIISINPTHILSLIGRTHGKINDKIYSTIDYLEQDGKLIENIRDNLYSPLNLAIIAHKHFIHYTYLGTGCIFEYDDNHPFGEEVNGFTEKSLPNFFGSSYSIVKGFTDRLMHVFPVLNLRIRMPINSENNPRNFITKITNYSKICSIPNSMSVLPELIPIMIDLMKKHHRGTINLTNPGLISHNEILQMYKEIVDPNFIWINFDIDEQNNILDSKRSNNYLDTNILQKLYPDIKNIKDAVRECLISYPKEVKKERIIYNIFDTSITNLLITNGFSFIGSNFINYIYDKFSKVNIYNIDIEYSNNNIRPDIINSKRYKTIKGNICSEDLINYILNEFNINYVIHFANQSHIENTLTKDNTLETYILLEGCRKFNKIIKFINISTVETYNKLRNDIDFIDNTLLKNLNSIVKPKLGAELVAQTYNNSFNMPIINLKIEDIDNLIEYFENIITNLTEDNKIKNIKDVIKLNEITNRLDNIIRIEELGIEYFNIYMYRCFNRDLDYMTDSELVRHFIDYGYHENRLYTLDLPDDFDTNEYKRLNDDLFYLSDFELKIHYVLHRDTENRKYKI